MRGQILDFNEQSDEGLISGDDGERYVFARRDLIRPGPLARGRQVDFISDGRTATQLVVLEYDDVYRRPDYQGSQDLPNAAPRHGPWGYFVRCCSTAYFQGEGRARRSEYWWFVLFHTLVIVALVVALACFGVIADANGVAAQDVDGYDAAIIGLALLIVMAFLFFIIPGITVLIRRLHDIGQTGLWVLIALLPLGGLILLVMTCMPTQPGSNQYGRPPE